MNENTFDAIRRLQQKIDHLDDQIILKRTRMMKFKGPMKNTIERELEEMLEQHEAIKRNILQLKKIELQTT